MKVFKSFKTEIMFFVGFIIIQQFYMNISVVFNQINFAEMMYLVAIEAMGFLIYILYKHLLFANQLERNTHHLVKDYIKILKLENVRLMKQVKTLETSNDEVYDIIYGYIHDLKTPVAAIKLSDPTKSIKKEIFRLEEIIEKLLYLSRITDIQNDLILNEYSINKLIKNVIRKYQTFFIEKKITLTLSFEDYDIITDQKWFEFAFSQILNNALKYTDRSGEIIITTDKMIQKKHIIIIDNGCGIPKGYLHRIFEKGFSYDQTNRYYKGTGIGLYIAKKIFDYLEVGCSIESTIKVGTKVALYINESKDLYYLTEV